MLLKDGAGKEFNWAPVYYPNGGIYNSNSNTVVSGTKKADFINNWGGTNIIINGGNGNDTILNGWRSSLSAIDGGAGNDRIFVQSCYETINGGSGNDTIYAKNSHYQKGRVYEFNAGGGSDVVIGYNSTDAILITDGSSYSTTKSGSDVKITVGDSARMTLKDATNQTLNIVNYKKQSSNSVKITGTSGRDYIVNTGENVTIQAGAGDDTIVGSDNGEMYLFSYASGNDVINDFGENDTLKSTSGSISAVDTEGDDVIVTIKKSNQTAVGRITLQGAGNSLFKTTDSYTLIRDDINYISNDKDSVKVTGTTGRDYITNDAEFVTIQAGAGNDTIDGSIFGELMLFSYASGDDVILNFDKKDTLKATSGTISNIEIVGNDALVTIKKSGQKTVGTVSVQLQDTRDLMFLKKINSTTVINDAPNYIDNGEDSIKISGTSVKDYITNTGENVTIQAGKGNDTIVGSDEYGETYLFSYASGNDVITNFGKNDTLTSTNGTLKYKKVGDDAVVTITKSKTSGTVTLQGAADYDFVQSGNTLTVKQIDTISPDADNQKVTGTTGDDYIHNPGYEGISIQAGKGNDTIDGSIFGETFMFSYAAGNNVVTNFGANDTLRNTSGTMSYKVSGDNVVVTIIYADNIKKTNSVLYVKGINVIECDKDNKKFSGTNGDDYIVNPGYEGVTIQAGAGDDIITGSDLFGETYLFSYASGDDTITNFGVGDTLRSTSGTLSYAQSGNDYVVTITKSGQKAVGTVTLQDAAENYTLQKSGSNYIARPKMTSSAQMPSDYWFLNEETTESDLDQIVEKETAVDMPTDFMADALNRKENLLVISARKRQK